LQEQDRILKSFPEVETVFGAVSRSDSATDNAPLDMYDTTVAEAARKMAFGMTYENLSAKWMRSSSFPD
jgi:Cu(I)/Ag(I) efflux system membrane protein CusA/SilA